MKKILSLAALTLLAVPAMFGQGFVSQGGELKPLELIDNSTMTCSGTVEITPNVPFTFVLDLSSYGMGQMTLGPEEDVYMTLEELSTGISDSLEMMGEGEFYLIAAEVTPLEITFVGMGESTYSIKLGDSSNIDDPVYVTFNFTGIEDGWEALTVPEGITGPSYTTQISKPGTNINFKIPDDSQYEIKGMEVTNRTSEETAGKVILENVISAWQASIYYDESFNGMEIDVDIVGKNNVTFNFTGIEDAYQAVTVFDMLSMDNIDISSNQYVLNYGTQAQIILGAKEGYSIEVSGPEYDGDPENAPYQIMSTDQNGVVQYAILVNPAANKSTFDVTVEAVVEAEKSATFNFTGVEDAYEYVNITEPDGENTIVLSSETYTYTFENNGFLVISPWEGYAMEIVCTTEDAEEGVDYSIQGLTTEGPVQYSVAIYSDGLTFDVNIEKLADPNYVTFNITGVENAYNYVEVFEEEEGAVTVSSGSYKFEYEEKGVVVFAAKEGYVVTVEGPEYTVEPEDAPYQIMSVDLNGSIQYSVYVTEAANGMTFTVTVSVDDSSGISSILNGESDATIYDLSGRKVSANKLGNGLFIINGKKVMIRK